MEPDVRRHLVPASHLPDLNLRCATQHFVTGIRPAGHHDDDHPFEFLLKPGHQQFRHVLIKNIQTTALCARRQKQVVIVKGERQGRVWFACRVSLAKVRIGVVLAGLKSSAVQLNDARLAGTGPHFRVVTGTEQRGRKLLNLSDQRVALQWRQTENVFTSRPPEVSGKMRVWVFLPVHTGNVRSCLQFGHRTPPLLDTEILEHTPPVANGEVARMAQTFAVKIKDECVLAERLHVFPEHPERADLALRQSRQSVVPENDITLSRQPSHRSFERLGGECAVDDDAVGGIEQAAVLQCLHLLGKERFPPR